MGQPVKCGYTYPYGFSEQNGRKLVCECLIFFTEFAIACHFFGLSADSHETELLRSISYSEARALAFLMLSFYIFPWIFAHTRLGKIMHLSFLIWATHQFVKSWRRKFPEKEIRYVPPKSPDKSWKGLEHNNNKYHKNLCPFHWITYFVRCLAM